MFSSTGGRGILSPSIDPQHRPHPRQHPGDHLHCWPSVASSLKDYKQMHTREAGRATATAPFAEKVGIRIYTRQHQRLGNDRLVGPMSAETWKRNHEGGLLQTSVIAASKTEHIRELLPCQRTATSRVVQLRSWQKTCEKGTGRGTSWNRTMPSLWHPSSRRTASEHAPDPSALHQAPCQLSSSSTSAVRHRCSSAPTSGYVDSHYLMIHLNWNWIDSISRRDSSDCPSTCAK